jgi:putative ABC transport system permease protein
LRRAWPAFSELKSFELLNARWGASVALTGEGGPLNVSIRYVTQHAFAFHGNRIVIGRGFSPEEYASEQALRILEVPAEGGVAILAQGLWQRAFGGRGDIVGRTVQLSGASFTVVGVATDGFGSANDSAEVYFPGNPDGQRASFAPTLPVTGRLKPGITLAQAQAELDVVGAGLAEQYPETRGFSTFVAPMRDFMTQDSRPMLLTLLGAVLCVLLIACANIASLLLLRATLRQREISVRVALGASRTRIVCQLLAESILLALAGGVAGIFVAQWTVDALRAYGPLPGIGTAGIEMDGRLIAFAIGLSALTALLFGLAPAWLASNVDLNEALKQGTRGSTESAARSRLRQLFVILQVAAATILLVTAGLLIRSFIQIARVDSGLLPENTFMIPTTVQSEKFPSPEHHTAFLNAMLTKIRSLPGVDAAAVTYDTPFSQAVRAEDNRPALRTWEFQIDGRQGEAPGHKPTAGVLPVSPGYFGVVGIQLLRGRDLVDHDDLRAPKVAIINHAFARQHFPAENPVGRRVLIINLPAGSTREWHEIVGVVADATQASPEQPITAQVYVAHAQVPFKRSMLTLFVRSERNVADLGRAIKAEVGPNQPIGAITPLQEHLDLRVRDRRFQLHLLSVFSFLALAISAVGIYGVISYSVSQRTTEIGIRMALGAQSTDVARLILKQGARLIGIGLIVGLGGAIVVGRIIQARLFQVSAWDPITLVLTGVIIAVVGLAACLIPMRRATKVDPIVALRAE